MKRVKHELSYHARILAARLRGGVALRLQLGATEEAGSEGKLYWIDPPGKKVGVKSAEELIAKGKVRPLYDGLFSGTSQSWRLE